MISTREHYLLTAQITYLEIQREKLVILASSRRVIFKIYGVWWQKRDSSLTFKFQVSPGVGSQNLGVKKACIGGIIQRQWGPSSIMAGVDWISHMPWKEYLRVNLIYESKDIFCPWKKVCKIIGLSPSKEFCCVSSLLLCNNSDIGKVN